MQSFIRHENFKTYAWFCIFVCLFVFCWHLSYFLNFQPVFRCSCPFLCAFTGIFICCRLLMNIHSHAWFMHEAFSHAHFGPFTWTHWLSNNAHNILSSHVTLFHYIHQVGIVKKCHLYCKKCVIQSNFFWHLKMSRKDNLGTLYRKFVMNFSTGCQSYQEINTKLSMNIILSSIICIILTVHVMKNVLLTQKCLKLLLSLGCN